jgi:hypothetical protein
MFGQISQRTNITLTWEGNSNLRDIHLLSVFSFCNFVVLNGHILYIQCKMATQAATLHCFVSIHVFYTGHNLATEISAEYYGAKTSLSGKKQFRYKAT